MPLINWKSRQVADFRSKEIICALNSRRKFWFRQSVLGAGGLASIFFTLADQSEGYIILFLERKIASQLDLQTIRRPFQTCASALIIDDEEITIGPIDVTQSHIDD